MVTMRPRGERVPESEKTQKLSEGRWTPRCPCPEHKEGTGWCEKEVRGWWAGVEWVKAEKFSEREELGGPGMEHCGMMLMALGSARPPTLEVPLLDVAITFPRQTSHTLQPLSGRENSEGPRLGSVDIREEGSWAGKIAGSAGTREAPSVGLISASNHRDSPS